MALTEINWNPDRRHLRRFGLVALIVFATVGAWVFFRGSLFGFALGPGTANGTACVLWGGAALCAILATAAPSLLRPLYLGLSLVGLPIGVVVSHVVMGVVFALVYWRTRRVMPLVIAHTLLDVVAFVGYQYLAGPLGLT